MLVGRIGKKPLEASHGIFLYVGQHVTVDVHGDVYAGVAEDLLEDLDGFFGLEPEGGERVAQGVEGRFFGQACFPREWLEVSRRQILAAHRHTY